MKVRLTRILREMASSGFTEDLATYIKEVELLMDPHLQMRIKDGDIIFYVDYIIQDLNTQQIILYENIDIIYHQNRDSEGFKKEREILSDNGWILL